MGAGLLAIQEWARNTNVVLHIVAVPYALYTSFVLGGPTDWRLGSQLVISAVIVIALTRPAIKYKFQTASSKRRSWTELSGKRTSPGQQWIHPLATVKYNFLEMNPRTIAYEYDFEVEDREILI